MRQPREKHFRDLTLNQAKAYFQQYLARAPERIDHFRETLAKIGGPSLEATDFSPESLLPIWGYLAPRLPEVAPEFALSEEPPDWAKMDITNLPSDILWLIDGLAYYFAECFIRHVPGAQWVLARMGKRYMYQNQPCIQVPDDHLNPRQLIIVNVSRAIDGIAEGLHRVQDLSPYLSLPEGDRTRLAAESLQPEKLYKRFRYWENIEEERKAFAAKLAKESESIKPAPGETIRVRGAEIAIHPAEPEEWAIPGFYGVEIPFDDDVQVVLDEKLHWSEAQLDALDVLLFAQLDGAFPVLWEDHEFLLVFLPEGHREPLKTVKKAVQGMVRKPLSEQDIPKWKKLCEEKAEAIIAHLRQAREEQGHV